MMLVGDSCPTLQPLAMKVLEQRASNSSFEHNWSSYKYVYSTVCNRLLADRADKLVYMYNNKKISNILQSDDYVEGMPIWMYNSGGRSDDEGIDKDTQKHCIINDATTLISNANIDTNVDVANEEKIAKNLEFVEVVINEAMLVPMRLSLKEDENDENLEEM